MPHNCFWATARYDLTPVPGTGLKDLNFPKPDDYFKRYNLDFSMENEDQKTILLQNTDILAVNGEATIAGLLIFGINPFRSLSDNHLLQKANHSKFETDSRADKFFGM